MTGDTMMTTDSNTDNTDNNDLDGVVYEGEHGPIALVTDNDDLLQSFRDRSFEIVHINESPVIATMKYFETMHIIVAYEDYDTLPEDTTSIVNVLQFFIGKVPITAVGGAKYPLVKAAQGEVNDDTTPPTIEDTGGLNDDLERENASIAYYESVTDDLVADVHERTVHYMLQDNRYF